MAQVRLVHGALHHWIATPLSIDAKAAKSPPRSRAARVERLAESELFVAESTDRKTYPDVKAEQDAIQDAIQELSRGSIADGGLEPARADRFKTANLTKRSSKVGDAGSERDVAKTKLFMVNPAIREAPSESRRWVSVEFIAVENQTALKTKTTTAIMKKTTLSAIVLIGLIGAATAQAGDYRHANGGYSERSRESTTTYVRPSRGYYNGGYAHGSGYGCDTGYGQHRALHQDLQAGHGDLHVGLRDAHQEAHRELRHERAHGASRRELKALHHDLHHDLSDAHQDGHAQLRDDHRAGHYDLGR